MGRHSEEAGTVDFEGHTATAIFGDVGLTPGKGLGTKYMKWTGVTRADAVQRILGESVRIHMDGLHARLNANRAQVETLLNEPMRTGEMWKKMLGKRTRLQREVNLMQEIYRIEDVRAFLDAKPGSPEYKAVLDKAQYYGTDMTQFHNTAWDMPHATYTTHFGKVVSFLRKFQYSQSRALKNKIVFDLRNGDPTTFARALIYIGLPNVAIEGAIAYGLDLARGGKTRGAVRREEKEKASQLSRIVSRVSHLQAMGVASDFLRVAVANDDGETFSDWLLGPSSDTLQTGYRTVKYAGQGEVGKAASELAVKTFPQAGLTRAMQNRYITPENVVAPGMPDTIYRTLLGQQHEEKDLRTWADKWAQDWLGKPTGTEQRKAEATLGGDEAKVQAAVKAISRAVTPKPTDFGKLNSTNQQALWEKMSATERKASFKDLRPDFQAYVWIGMDPQDRQAVQDDLSDKAAKIIVQQQAK
jgi:hypothetical protein